MSGFFVQVRWEGGLVEERFLEKVADQLKFRGPEGTAVWAKNGIGGAFACMRTGPTRGAKQQPVIWKDRFWLWGDIRLDAREELRQELGRDDVCAEIDASSEELLLCAWEEWGEGALEKVIGDFSFALWDAREKTLWCARDFVGARPFYYAQSGKTFYCSNTLEILRQVPEISDGLDEGFIGDFLLHGWNVEPARTVYRQIRRLPSGHVLKMVGGVPEVRRFRKLSIEEPLKLGRAEEYVEAYLEVLKPAVKERLAAGPTALYLSGGLDSSTVCALAAQITQEPGSKEQLKAFTVSWEPFFEDPEPLFAKLTAAHLGIAHEVLEEANSRPFEGMDSDEGRIPEPNEQIFFRRDQRFCEKIASHAKVVLSGDGGDDILTGQGWPYLRELGRKGDWKEIARAFGGYFLTRRRVPALRAGIRVKLGRMLQTKDPYDGYPTWLNEGFEERAGLRQRWVEVQNRTKEQEHPWHPQAYAGLHDEYWAQVLETEDAGWTRVCLEARAPLLDLRVLRLLLRLPPVPWCMNKELSRQALKNLLPAKVVGRPKTPLRKDPLETYKGRRDWLEGVSKDAPERVKEFVNWGKWWKTFCCSKGSLRWGSLRPVCLLYWLKGVEKRQGIE